VILYWQKGFDGYLRKEYTLGQDLWLYLSIVALNHERDAILVFIRDFSQAPDEKVIEKRLEIIKEKQNKINDSTT